MKFTKLNIPAAGTSKRDCELYAFNTYPDLSLEFNKDSDETKWKLIFDGYIAFKVTSHEFMIHLILLDALPDEGAFFIYHESPWLQELKKVDMYRHQFCEHKFALNLFSHGQIVPFASSPRAA